MPQKFQSALPTGGVGWGHVPPNDAQRNNTIISGCNIAARELEIAWGKGGSQGTKAVKQWDKQFRLLSFDILDLFTEGRLNVKAKEAALQACAAILAMEEEPHWEDGHVEDIRNIREYLEPSGYWNDYPEVEGEEDEEGP